MRNTNTIGLSLITATAVAIFGLVTLSGCNDTVTDPTSVIVEIQSEFQALTEIDQVKIALNPSGKMLDYAVGSESDSSKKSFPIKFGLLPTKASDEDFAVEVEGLLGGVTIVKTGADAKFAKGETGHLVLILHKVCAQKLDCEGGAVCGMDGTCSVLRARGPLPEYVDPKGARNDGSVKTSTDGGPCSPMSCAERGINCGTVQNCGVALDCGNCTTANETCGGGNTPNLCGCTTTTCAASGKDCGTTPDGCGGTLTCGTCPGGQSCGGKGPNRCGTETCNVKTCASLGTNCGPVSDGCAATLDCGTCSAPNICGGGKLGPNVCGCTPTTCAASSANCGEVPDGCGGKLNCGQCTQPKVCGGGGTANLCGCMPMTCQALRLNCGTVPDGCGGTLNCGGCANGDVCGGGGANVCGAKPCVSTTCQAQGANCGTISNGCGGTLNCGNTCPANQTCAGGGTPNVCGCTPTTCQAQSKICGSIPDGCGGTLNCGNRCQGNDCETSLQCASGFCIDNVCCETSCAGQCRACQQGTGTCLNVRNATDPGTCSNGLRCNDSAVCKVLDGGNCTTPGDCLTGTCNTYYPDGDADTWGRTADLRRVCGMTPPPNHVTDGGDCCDIDPESGPYYRLGNQPTDYKSTVNACGTWDWNCDNVVSQQYLCNSSMCSTDPANDCQYGQVWQQFQGIPACGVTASGGCVCENGAVVGFSCLDAFPQKCR